MKTIQHKSLHLINASFIINHCRQQWDWDEQVNNEQTKSPNNYRKWLFVVFVQRERDGKRVERHINVNELGVHIKQ